MLFRSHNANSGSSFSGAGTIGFSGGTTNLAGLAGTYNVSGRTLVNGGTANFNSAASTGTLELTGGTLGGSSTFTVSGLTTWTGGTMQDGGQTTTNGGMTISGASQKNINVRTLNATGPTTWTGTGNIGGGAGSTIINTGLFDIQTDADVVNQSGGTATFTNSGSTLRKSVATGQTDFNSPDRKSTRLNSSHIQKSRMPSSA